MNLPEGQQHKYSLHLINTSLSQDLENASLQAGRQFFVALNITENKLYLPNSPSFEDSVSCF